MSMLESVSTTAGGAKSPLANRRVQAAQQGIEQKRVHPAATGTPASPAASVALPGGTHSGKAPRLACDIEVPGEGPLSARLWIVGEAPGEQEVLARRPFVGMAGKVLSGILAEACIKREECRIENVINYRPLNNKFGEFYNADGTPTKLLELQIARLHGAIHQNRPNVILCLGAEAFRAVYGKPFAGGINMWRGSIVEGVGGSKVVATFHPSYLLRSWRDRPLAVADAARALRESASPDFKRVPRETSLGWSFERLCRRLEEMRESPFVAFDIETDARSRITSIALADSPEFACVVPVSFRGREQWEEWELEKLRGLVRAVLEDPRVEKIAQNAQYDMIWLADKWGIGVKPLYMDTMVAHNLLSPEFEKSLAFQCSIYTDIPYYKFERSSDDPEVFFRYNAMDAMATFECAVEIETQLREAGLWDFYRRLPHKLLAPLRELSMRGLRVDLELKKKMTREMKAEIVALREAICAEPTVAAFESEVVRGKVAAAWRKKWEGSKILLKRYPKFEDYLATKELPSFNPDSPAQVAEYLYKWRRFEPIFARRGDGKKTLTADSAAIKKINTKTPEPVLQAFLDIADLTKQLEFLEVKLEPDDRIHCTYDITGTETGRISSRKYVYDTGANLQNQPAGKKKASATRRIFIPDEGKVFLQRDLKQAEAWVVAFLSEDPFFMDAIRSSDIHRRTASLIFRKPESEITKRERELAKRCVHALNYGMGYIKFAEQLGVSVVEARDLRNRYFAAFPRLQVWHSEVKLRLEKTRELVTPMGRKRQFASGWDEDLWKAAWAYVPQSTVGDLLNTGFVEFWEWLGMESELGIPHGVMFDCQIMLQIHDSLVVQCPEQHVKFIAGKMKQFLERPIVVNGREIVIPTDLSVGPNWMDLKEVVE